jgi:hypothetical protein
MKDEDIDEIVSVVVPMLLVLPFALPIIIFLAKICYWLLCMAWNFNPFEDLK